MADDLLKRLHQLRGGAALVDNGDMVDLMVPCTVEVTPKDHFKVRNHAAALNWVCDDLQRAIIRVVTSLELSRRRVEGAVTGCAAVPLLWDLFAAMQLCWQTPPAVRKIDIGVPTDRMHSGDLERVKNAAAALLHVWLSAMTCYNCEVHAPGAHRREVGDDRLACRVVTRRLARAAYAVDKGLRAGQDRIAWLIVAKRRCLPRDVAKLVLKWVPLEVQAPEDYLRAALVSIAAEGRFIPTLAEAGVGVH